MSASGTNAPVLRVERLRVAYDHPLGEVRAVDDVSFSLRPHERFGLAGESGSGKSTMALAILRLIQPARAHRRRSRCGWTIWRCPRCRTMRCASCGLPASRWFRKAR